MKKNKRRRWESSRGVGSENIVASEGQSFVQNQSEFNDILLLLPQEPTLSDALEDEEHLELLLQAREVATKLWHDLEEIDWELVTDKAGVELYKTDTDSQ